MASSINASEYTPFKSPRLLLGIEYGSSQLIANDDKYLSQYKESGQIVAGTLGYRSHPNWVFEVTSRELQDFIGPYSVPTEYGVFDSVITVEIDSLEFSGNYYHQWNSYWYSTAGLGISKFERTGSTYIDDQTFGFEDDGFGVLFKVGLGYRFFHEMSVSLNVSHSELKDVETESVTFRVNFEF